MCSNCGGFGERGFTVRFTGTVKSVIPTHPRIDLHPSLYMGAKQLSPETGWQLWDNLGVVLPRRVLWTGRVGHWKEGPQHRPWGSGERV